MNVTSKTTYLNLLFLLLLLIFLITACADKKVESIMIYITATPSPEPFQSGADHTGKLNTIQYSENNPIALDAPAAFAITDTPPPPFPTSTPSSTPLYTLTPTLTSSPPPKGTLLPTKTPATLSPLDMVIPPSDSLPVLDGYRMGVQLHPFLNWEEWDYTLTKILDMGVEWLKVQIPWDLMEPSPGQYSPLFATYQLQMGKTGYQLSHRFLVMISITNAPAWARPPGADPNLHGPPADPHALGNFIQAFLSGFNKEDHVIDAIEIWNEPNLDHEWNGMPISGAKYMELFRVNYDIIKQIDPNIIVITAGLAPVGDGLPGAVGDRTYLQQMYDAGLAQFPDIKIGAHPYGWGNPPDGTCCTTERGWADNRVFYFKDTLEDYAAIINRNGHGAKIWVTEFGWGTLEGVTGDERTFQPPPEAVYFDLNTAQSQSQYTVRAFELMQTSPLGDAVEVAILWNLNFARAVDFESTRDQRAGYSLLDTNGKPRLLYKYLEATRKVQHTNP